MFGGVLFLFLFGLQNRSAGSVFTENGHLRITAKRKGAAFCGLLLTPFSFCVLIRAFYLV